MPANLDITGILQQWDRDPKAALDRLVRVGDRADAYDARLRSPQLPLQYHRDIRLCRHEGHLNYVLTRAREE